MLRSEIPSGICAKFLTVATSNNRDHPTRSLLLSPLASTINCSPGSQALLEVTYQDHSIQITLLFVRSTQYIFALGAHPIRGESHNQRNATGEVATVISHKYNSNSLAAVLHTNKSNVAANCKKVVHPWSIALGKMKDIKEIRKVSIQHIKKL